LRANGANVKVQQDVDAPRHHLDDASLQGCTQAVIEQKRAATAVPGGRFAAEASRQAHNEESRPERGGLMCTDCVFVYYT
jgi:hypothetical protein